MLLSDSGREAGDIQDGDQVWRADEVIEWGDKKQFPVIAGGRDVR